MKLEFLDLPSFDGATNMAMDVELLKAAEAGRAGFRIYTWNEAWVSLGRFQRPESALVPGWQQWVLRPTGGRAVLHGHDLTVAIAVPVVRDELRGLREIYARLVSPLIETLRKCGVDAELPVRARRPRLTPNVPGEDCFAFASAYDILDRADGHKVCGCAMRVTSSAALLQASIPYREPLVDPSGAIAGAIRFPFKPWDHQGFAAHFGLG